MGPINLDGQRFLDSLGERLSSVSGDPRETTFLYQRLSVLIQIFNSVAFRGTLLPETVTETVTPEPVSNFVFNPRDLYYRV